MVSQERISGHTSASTTHLRGPRGQTKPVIRFRVLIVEDNLPFLTLLTSIVSQQPHLEIIAASQNGLEAVQLAKSLQPELILLDIGLPGLNGIEAARQIRQLAPAAKIVFVTQESSPDVVEEAFNAGACGFVRKVRTAEDLIIAIVNVCKGAQFVSHGLR
jgi:two-component system nitrate/nitrite response regulator NarL